MQTEKAKRGKRPHILNHSWALGLIITSLIFLSIVSPLSSFGELAKTTVVLPEPRFLFIVSVILTWLFINSVFALILQDFIKAVLASIVLFGCLFALKNVFNICLIYFFAYPYYLVFHLIPIIPSFVFPFLLLIVCIATILIRNHLHEISLKVLQAFVLGFLFFTLSYFVGQTSEFVWREDDDILSIEGKTYHLILENELNGYAYLYECELGYFFCQRIFQGDWLNPWQLSLSFDSNERILTVSGPYVSRKIEIAYQQSIP